MGGGDGVTLRPRPKSKDSERRKSIIQAVSDFFHKKSSSSGSPSSPSPPSTSQNTPDRDRERDREHIKFPRFRLTHKSKEKEKDKIKVSLTIVNIFLPTCFLNSSSVSEGLNKILKCEVMAVMIRSMIIHS